LPDPAAGVFAGRQGPGLPHGQLAARRGARRGEAVGRGHREGARRVEGPSGTGAGPGLLARRQDPRHLQRQGAALGRGCRRRGARRTQARVLRLTPGSWRCGPVLTVRPRRRSAALKRSVSMLSARTRKSLAGILGLLAFALLGTFLTRGAIRPVPT